MKQISMSICVGIACFCLSSCYCDKYTVGNVSTHQEIVHVASVHNAHFIWGAFVKHDTTKHYVANLENYIIENKRTFGDLLVSGITLGIYTPTTTKFYVPENNSNAIVTKKKFHSKAYKGYLSH